MDSSSSFPIDALERIESPAEIEDFLKAHPQLQMPAAVEQIHAKILSGIVVDPERAHRLSKLARWIAEASQDEYTMALADRCEGHVQYSASNYSAALRCYESAVEHFERLGRDTDVARTLSGAMQSLIYLGLDEKALRYSERARLIFERDGDELRLARLDSNIGNIRYRQDRYAEARKLYRQAFERLIGVNRPQDAAAVLSNMAVASTGLGEFDQAEEEYAQSRRIANHEGLRSLAAELDYNVAYLHFLRGNHTRALVLYRETRRHSEAIGDAYHAALCDLDQAEVYLDLNLIEESVHLSQSAASRFEQLGMNYERAKALTFSGIGEHLRENTRRALVLFSNARRLFVEGRNPVWPAIVDFYRSILLCDLGQTGPAFKLAVRADQVFESESLPNRRALVKLLMAGMFLDQGQPMQALQYADFAILGLDAADHPMVFFHSEYLRARILKLQGESRRAFAAFGRAAGLLESVRCRLAGDDLKVAFVRNKLDVYSQLMLLSHELLPVPERGVAIFECIEKSKSRSLADRVAFLQTNPQQETPVSAEFLRVRERLNALYREMDFRQADRRDVGAVRNRVVVLERRLSELMREESLDDNAPSRTADWAPVGLEDLAKMLPPGAQIVEFFVTDQRLWAGVIGKSGADFRDLGAIDPVYSALSLLTFQITQSQHHTGALRSARLGQAATLAHLQALYKLLIQPIESLISGDDLIVVPHGSLHGLPFHALHDGNSYLIDRSTVSYAPSATVFCLCKRKVRSGAKRSLLLGVPDEKSPAIADEIESVARLVPEPSVFLGEKATTLALFEHAASSRYIHIAAHGDFRRDNPIFSSVRLEDGQVNVLDLYRLRLDAELVTLSGCSTGAGIIVGGDELVGLARGLMHAGARAVLLALWEVHDPSTAIFMRYFYENLQTGKSCAAALRNSMLDLKREWPEPYYWAPFTVSGYALQSQENLSGTIFFDGKVSP